MIGLIIFVVSSVVVVPVILICCRGSITMQCPCCKHEWVMKKSVYMNTPYVQRGINGLFICAKCGSQGEKKKK